MNRSNILFSFFVLLIWTFAFTCAAYAQDEAKSIHSDTFTKNRLGPKSAAMGANSTAKTSYKVVKKTPRKPRVESSKSKPATKPRKEQFEDASLGVTVWKLRPALKTDEAKELLEEESAEKFQTSEFSLERLESGKPITLGERIRLSVESLSHSGYLYVVDRELYSDGTFSAPKLIYPTLKTKNRNFPTGAGDLIFIPDSPRFFRVNSFQKEKTLVAEVLTFIVSPNPLINDSMLKTTVIELPSNQFEEWLELWEADTTMLEEIGNAAIAITLVEKSAGDDYAKGLTEESNKLKQNDPAPQSIFSAKIKKGDAVLFNVSLIFRENKQP